MRYPGGGDADENALWEGLLRCQGESFITCKGLVFQYEIRGGEVFVDRKAKSITRATVNAAFRRAKQIEAEGGLVDGPKKLGTFGASYLYPIFLRLGVLKPPGSEGQTRLPI